MNKKPRSSAWFSLVAAGLLALSLTSCGGGSNDAANNQVPAGDDVDVSGIATGAAALRAATQLTITVTGVRVAGRPEVDFTVTDESSKGMTGLVTDDLRFNIAKLVPGTDGGPADWQNYINRAEGGAVKGHQERTGAGNVFGTLVRHGGGAYTYTFATDITDASANPCPAPCTTAAGKPLDIRFQPTLTHRVTIQQANTSYVPASGILDFVPNGTAVSMQQEVVATATCNSCHATLTAHGNRTDTRLCVTCHNPGSWVAGAAGAANESVDFKSMVHRIHYNNAGLALPSVRAGTPFKIGDADFSAVTFPQDARNCTRCHDGTAGAANATPQGDHWKSDPSIAACGSCHDNVYFGGRADPARPYQTKAHSGGAMSDNAACATCHAAGRFAVADGKDISIAHGFPARLKAAAARFEYKILGATPTTPGATPVITFSVTDPSNGDTAYDIKTAAAFTAGAASTLTVKIGWTTTEFDNGGSGLAFGQPVDINALSAAATCSAGVCTVTSPVAIPAGQSGTLRVMMEGHPAGDVTTPGSFTDRLPAKSVFKDFAISGALVARRSVVDIAKCNVCHDSLSLHGNNRSNEIGVCVVCHNGNATDKARRPVALGVDGKAEESVDFKTMIHAIHAGQADKGGFRTKGLTVYGFGGSINDFSGVVFPGKLSNCGSCHTGTSYQLTGTWVAPAQNGILGSTVDSATSPTDPADNLRVSPTAAVCLSCHDRLLARQHVTGTVFVGASGTDAGGSLSSTQVALAAGSGEQCVACHGPGQVADVKTMHGVK